MDFLEETELCRLILMSFISLASIANLDLLGQVSCEFQNRLNSSFYEHSFRHFIRQNTLAELLKKLAFK